MKSNLIYKIFYLGIAMCALATNEVSAATPSTISFSGFLKGTGASAGITGQKNMTFKLFASSTGGSVLWTQSLTNVQVTNGRFQVVLGAGDSTLATALQSPTPPTHIEIVVAGETLSPRFALSAAPYAIAGGSASGGGILPTGTITTRVSTTPPSSDYILLDGSIIATDTNIASFLSPSSAYTSISVANSVPNAPNMGDIVSIGSSIISFNSNLQKAVSSNDGGNTWSAGSGMTNWPDSGRSVAINGSNIILAGYAFAKSTDSGSTFIGIDTYSTFESTAQSVFCTDYVGGEYLALVKHSASGTESMRIWASTNGSSWTQRAAPSQWTSNYSLMGVKCSFVSAFGNLILSLDSMSGQLSGIYTSADNGATWSEKHGSIAPQYIINSGSKLCGISGNYSYYSSDGNNWIMGVKLPDTASFMFQHGSLLVLVSNSTTPKAYFSTDCNSWNDSLDLPPGSYPFAGVSVSANEFKIFASGQRVFTATKSTTHLRLPNLTDSNGYKFLKIH